nr:hypothetical protein Iba_chr04bCG13450 [Ipomoea batatas]
MTEYSPALAVSFLEYGRVDLRTRTQVRSQNIYYAVRTSTAASLHSPVAEMWWRVPINKSLSTQCPRDELGWVRAEGSYYYTPACIKSMILARLSSETDPLRKEIISGYQHRADILGLRKKEKIGNVFKLMFAKVLEGSPNRSIRFTIRDPTPATAQKTRSRTHKLKSWETTIGRNLLVPTPDGNCRGLTHYRQHQNRGFSPTPQPHTIPSSVPPEKWDDSVAGKLRQDTSTSDAEPTSARNCFAVLENLSGIVQVLGSESEIEYHVQPILFCRSVAMYAYQYRWLQIQITKDEGQ